MLTPVKVECLGLNLRMESPILCANRKPRPIRIPLPEGACDSNKDSSPLANSIYRISLMESAYRIEAVRTARGFS